MRELAKALAMVSHLILGLSAIAAITVLALKGIVSASVAVPSIMAAGGVMYGGSAAIQKTERDALMQKPPTPEESDHHGV